MRSFSQQGSNILHHHLSHLLRVVVRRELVAALAAVPGASCGRVVVALAVDNAAACPLRAVGHVQVATVG